MAYTVSATTTNTSCSFTVNVTAVSGYTYYRIYMYSYDGATLIKDTGYVLNGLSVTVSSTTSAAPVAGGTYKFNVMYATSSAGAGALAMGVAYKSANPRALSSISGSAPYNGTATINVAYRSPSGEGSLVHYTVNGVAHDNLNFGTTTQTFSVAGWAPGNYTISNAYVSVVTDTGPVLNSTTISGTLTVAAPPIPATPTIVFDSATSTTYSFHWSAVANATFYKVYKNGVIYNSNATSPFQVTGLSPGTTYTMGLSANNASGESGIATNSGTTPISYPSGISVSSTSNTSMTVSWTAITGGASNYTVRYSTNESTWTTTSTTTSTSKLVTGLTAGTLYYFQVMSSGPNANSGYSASVSDYTKPNTPSITSCAQYPSGELSIKATWGNLTSGATYYIQARIAGTTTWYDHGNTTLSTYTFAVQAIGSFDVKIYAQANGITDGTGAIVYNISVSVPPPAMPTIIFDTSTTTTFSFHWSAVSGATSYIVRKKKTGDSSFTLVTSSATSPYTVTGLLPGTEYTIALSAVGDGGESTADTMVGTMVCSAPVLDLWYRDEGTLWMNWPAVTGAIAYGGYLVRLYDGYSTYFDTSTAYVSLSGLQYGVNYEVYIFAQNIHGTWSASSNTWNGITDPQTPTISVGTVTTSSIQIIVGNISGSHNDPGIRIYYGTSTNPTTNYVTCNPTGYYNFTGLTPGTTYYYQAKSIYTWTDSNDYFSINYSNEVSATPSTRPSNWTGFTWIVPGAQFATNGNKTVYPITAALWNQFTGRVSQFRTYKGMPYTFTSVAQYSSFSDTVINLAITKVNDMIDTPALYIPLVSGTITAQTFIDLQARLNEL